MTDFNKLFYHYIITSSTITFLVRVAENSTYDGKYVQNCQYCGNIRLN